MNPGTINTRERLYDAALNLYAKRGYENVSVAEIAQHAGVTRRTFFRYFADKREVLFVGSDRLQPALLDIVEGISSNASPVATALEALSILGGHMFTQVEPARMRRDIIAASPELLERERTKLAGLTFALAQAMTRRAVSTSHANLLSNISVIVFQAAYNRWLSEQGRMRFKECFDASTSELFSVLQFDAISESTRK